MDDDSLIGKLPIPEPVDPRLLIEVSDARSLKAAGYAVLLQKARDFLNSFAWVNCPYAQYLGGGVPGAFGVFLFEIVPAANRKDVDKFVWVIASDGRLPTAYLVVDNSPNWVRATNTYIRLATAWIDCARAGGDMSTVYPFEVLASADAITSFESAVHWLSTEVIEKHRSLLD